jgi:hypothetical protein
MERSACQLNFKLNFMVLMLLFSISRTVFGIESAASLCGDFSDVRRANCLRAFHEIPNKKALAYTLKYWNLNSGRLRDRSCVTHDRNIAARGIRNNCQVLINDIVSTHQGNPNRANAYFVDLCASSPGSVVRKTYINKGTGTRTFSYRDREGAHTTTPGAFLTGSRIVPFIPFKLSQAYRGLKNRFGGMIPRLDLVGLQSTNNHTSDGKPMHVSPYRSSWGCPSLNPNDLWIMRKLAANGPSLVMNYGPERFHPETSLTKCDAVPDEGAVRVYRVKRMRNRVRGRIYSRRGRGYLQAVSPNFHRSRRGRAAQ